MKLKTLEGLPSGCLKIGMGTLDWDPVERKSDRYGSVGLTLGSKNINGIVTPPPEGQFGTLYAEITKVGPRAHIGDIFNGFKPGGAEVGMKVCLGRGKARNYPAEVWVRKFGVEPVPTRDNFWLHPPALYVCHNCEVKLWWRPNPSLDWRYIKRVGHKYFRDGSTGRIAIADDSGKCPHQTEDGVLWLDMQRSCTSNLQPKGLWSIPLLTPDGGRSSTVGDIKEAIFVSSLTDRPLNIGGYLYKMVEVFE